MQVETFAFLGKSYVSKIETPCCSILFPNLETNNIYIYMTGNAAATLQDRVI